MIDNTKIKLWTGFTTIAFLLLGLFIFLSTIFKDVPVNYEVVGICLMAIGIFNLYVFDNIKEN